MKLLGFNLTKISIEKKKDRVENLKIGTRIDVADITNTKADMLKTKEDILAVKFTFGLDYEPDMAKLDLEGNLIISLEPKKTRELMREWKEKKMPDDFRLTLFNLILRKASLKALQLEDEMNLPIHIHLPVLKIPDKKE